MTIDCMDGVDGANDHLLCVREKKHITRSRPGDNSVLLACSNNGYRKETRHRQTTTSASLGNQEDCNAISAKSWSSNLDEKQNPSQSQAIQALQHVLLVSDKRSQKLCQRIQNVQKAVMANKAPSISTNNLQSQESKKQQSKELKMERKLNKKKRGGGKKVMQRMNINYSPLGRA
ncbi:hypothetical protein HJC23_010628 [Cyclotella cryptica]|uniref:Uncharacterized protein n=1 Tax=Cyclotella cryptica TaxID=29204 RepID=A0ABD3NKB7_9STRA